MFFNLPGVNIENLLIASCSVEMPPAGRRFGV